MDKALMVGTIPFDGVPTKTVTFKDKKMDKTSTKIIIQALMILADDIESGDGVANVIGSQRDSSFHRRVISRHSARLAIRPSTTTRASSTARPVVCARPSAQS